jgi:hypothetical protein
VQGAVKTELARGEHKSLQTDRVILMPGPDDEVRIVNDIYRWFIDDGLVESEIAGRLNGMRVQTDLCRDWTRATVHEVLTNEKYVGHNVYNRVSFKLKKLRVVNAPDMWIRREGAFTGIVAPDVFYTAQGIIRARARRYTDEELIDRLRGLYRHRGFLSGLVIDESEGMPSASVYVHRFGSLIRAYQMVGYTPDRDYRFLEINRFLRRTHPEIVEQIEKQIASLGGSVVRDPATDLLWVNREFSVSVVLARCQTTPCGHNRWKIRLDSSLSPDISVAARLDPSNQAQLDYYLLPRIDFGPSRISLAEQEPGRVRELPLRVAGLPVRDGGQGPLEGCRMTTQLSVGEVRSLPIDKIEVLNPRERNSRAFSEVVANIKAIGLKKPIVVTPRTSGRRRRALPADLRRRQAEGVQVLGRNCHPSAGHRGE